MKYSKLFAGIILAASLTGCIGSVIGVAVDTTTAVVKAPFQITGAVIGVAADTTGTVIAAPFRMANAAVGGGGHNKHDRHHGHEHGPHDREESHQRNYEHEHSAEH